MSKAKSTAVPVGAGRTLYRVQYGHMQSEVVKSQTATQIKFARGGGLVDFRTRVTPDQLISMGVRDTAQGAAQACVDRCQSAVDEALDELEAAKAIAKKHETKS